MKKMTNILMSGIGILSLIFLQASLCSKLKFTNDPTYPISSNFKNYHPPSDKGGLATGIGYIELQIYLTNFSNGLLNLHFNENPNINKVLKPGANDQNKGFFRDENIQIAMVNGNGKGELTNCPFYGWSQENLQPKLHNGYCDDFKISVHLSSSGLVDIFFNAVNPWTPSPSYIFYFPESTTITGNFSINNNVKIIPFDIPLNKTPEGNNDINHGGFFGDGGIHNPDLTHDYKATNGSMSGHAFPSPKSNLFMGLGYQNPNYQWITKRTSKSNINSGFKAYGNWANLNYKNYEQKVNTWTNSGLTWNFGTKYSLPTNLNLDSYGTQNLNQMILTNAIRYNYFGSSNINGVKNPYLNKQIEIKDSDGNPIPDPLNQDKSTWSYIDLSKEYNSVYLNNLNLYGGLNYSYSYNKDNVSYDWKKGLVDGVLGAIFGGARGSIPGALGGLFKGLLGGVNLNDGTTTTYKKSLFYYDKWASLIIYDNISSENGITSKIGLLGVLEKCDPLINNGNDAKYKNINMSNLSFSLQNYTDSGNQLAHTTYDPPWNNTSGYWAQELHLNFDSSNLMMKFNLVLSN